MFRTGFVDMYDAMVNNTLFMTSKGNDPINIAKMEKKARKFATQVGLETVNKWAFEYSAYQKAPIISGTPVKAGEKMTGLDYTTAIGSVAGLFLHYPMKFAALQAGTLKNAADKAIAGDFWNSDTKNVMAFAGVFGLVRALSLAFSQDLHHLMENDTVNRISNLIDYATEEDPEQRKYQRGIINDFTGPIVQDLIFLGNVAGLYSMPDSEWGKMMIGYTDYYDMTEDEQQRARWLKYSTEIGKWRTRIGPGFIENPGMDTWLMQEFGIYPRSWTRKQRATLLSKLGAEPVESKAKSKKKKDPLLSLAQDLGSLRR
jgi:hypothetical protein